MTSPTTPSLPDLASGKEHPPLHIAWWDWNKTEAAWTAEGFDIFAAGYEAGLRASPQAGPTTPLAFEKTWTDPDTGGFRRRVDLGEGCEPWLERLNPTITPLYARPPVEDVPRLRAALEALVKQFRAYRTESGLSHSDAHNYLVRYDLWAKAEAALSPAPSQDAPRETEVRFPVPKSEPNLPSSHVYSREA